MTYIGRTWFILAEFNFYWQNITSTGRISLPLAEHDLYWLIVTLTGRIMTYFSRIWLPLAEYDLYWLIVTLTGRICSQSKVFCRSALLCRVNIPQHWTHKLPHRTDRTLYMTSRRTVNRCNPLQVRTHFTTRCTTRCTARCATSCKKINKNRERKCTENYNKFRLFLNCNQHFGNFKR